MSARRFRGREAGQASPRRLLRGLIWACAALVPRAERRVVLYGLTESEDGVLALIPELVSRGCHIVRLTAGPPSRHRVQGVRYVSKRSLRGLWAYARAGAVFTSHALYSGLPELPHQQLVLLWHGEVVKPVGLLDHDAPLAASCAPVCSDLGRMYRCAEFGLRPDRVPVVGAPRNDRLLSADRTEVRGRLGWDLDARIWVWLPTYRVAVRGAQRTDGEAAATGLPFGSEDLARLDALLEEEGTDLFLKPHPLAEQSVPSEGRRLRLLTQGVLDESGVSLYELLAATDGLVTDVSSVWLDYLVLDKPVVFAFPDIDTYRARRGLNLEPYEDWIPGPLTNDVDTFARLVGRPEPAGARAGREASRRRFHRHLDAQSSRRLLDLLDL